MIKRPINSEKQAQRDAIIRAALPHVPFDGWTRTTLAAAAERTGLEASAAVRLFPNGGKDAVLHFMDLADREMMDDLAGRDFAALKIRERISVAVRTRLERWTPYREAVRRALALLPLPSIAGGALRGWYNTVDVIWRAAGDRSTDFNFYTKRGLLAGVYGATLVYWLDDRSEGCANTWAFLDRRINDVMQIQKLRGRIEERLKVLPDPRRIFDVLTGRAFRASGNS